MGGAVANSFRSTCVVLIVSFMQLLLMFGTLSVSILCTAPPAFGRQAVRDYFALLEERFCKRWSDAATCCGVSADARQRGKAVLTFRIDRSGRISKVRIKHYALESVLPIHRAQLSDDCRRLDQSLLEAVSSVGALPEPPAQLNCPRSMVMLFDPLRFDPLKVMYDDIPVAELRRKLY